jgi:hypothetical protein
MSEASLVVGIDYGDKHYTLQIAHDKLMHVKYLEVVETAVYAGVYQAILDFHGRLHELQKENYKMRQAIMGSRDRYIRGELISEGVKL